MKVESGKIMTVGEGEGDFSDIYVITILPTLQSFILIYDS